MMAIAQLGYLVFEVSDLPAWERFAVDVLGLAVSERRDDGGFLLQLDSHQQRIVIEPGPADDLAAVGWQIADRAALDAIVTRLKDAKIDVVHGAAEEAHGRCVEHLVSLRDPSGIRCELFCNPQQAAKPFESAVVQSGFVAEEQGLGHLVIRADSTAESEAFYSQLLGFRLSDRIQCESYGIGVDLAFFHTNARHHSLAFGQPAPDKRIHHFMLQAECIDDVGLAYDRTIRARLAIANTLGRHPNDRMFSFYAFTPSGFQFEFGWGARSIDEQSWTATSYDCISEWGHHPAALIGRRAPKTPGSGS
jgi:2,3-dihydroxybiphenyl 1,2-dioxygenase